LESALERPRSRFRYDPKTDLPALAAAYGFGISSSHPFLDGNMRVTFQAMYVYLGLNGFRFEAPEEEVVTVILSLASGEIEETQLAEWLRGHLSPR
jgi:death-on-curing protein